MNTITVIKETLLPILPEDIIRNITSFLIMKIPKNDYRYKMLEEYLFYNRSYCSLNHYIFMSNRL